MDEEITIIDTNARNERIKNFFINNKKKLIIIISIILVIIIGYLSFENSKEKNRISIDVSPEKSANSITRVILDGIRLEG